MWSRNPETALRGLGDRGITWAGNGPRRSVAAHDRDFRKRRDRQAEPPTGQHRFRLRGMGVVAYASRRSRPAVCDIGDRELQAQAPDSEWPSTDDPKWLNI